MAQPDKPGGTAGSTGDMVTEYAEGGAESLEGAKRMLEADPENLDLKDWVAFMMYSNGAWDDALALFQALLTADYKPASQYLYIGNCYYRKGLMPLAAESWRKAAELDPVGVTGRKAAQRLRKLQEETGG